MKKAGEIEKNEKCEKEGDKSMKGGKGIITNRVKQEKYRDKGKNLPPTAACQSKRR